jgi:hypothetical protein
VADDIQGNIRVSQEERSICWEVIVSAILIKWRAVFSFPATAMRHHLKHVNRFEAVVTVDSHIVEVLLKMPHIFTNVECADTLYVYGFYNVCATAAVEEYRPTETVRSRTHVHILVNLFC